MSGAAPWLPYISLLTTVLFSIHSLSLANLSPPDLKKILSKPGSGRNKMLTKGDVLFALGKISDATGSAGKMGVTSYGVKGAKLAEVSVVR